MSYRVGVERATLVLIEGEKDAQRLIVSWPTAANLEGPEQQSFWSRISGVDIEDVERWEPILFTHGILGPNGYVDPDALTFISEGLDKPKSRKVMR